MKNQLRQGETIRRVIETTAAPLRDAGEERAVLAWADEHGGHSHSLIRHASRERLERTAFDAAVGEDHNMPRARVDILQREFSFFDRGKNHCSAARGETIEGAIEIEVIGGRLNRGGPALGTVELDD